MVKKDSFHDPTVISIQGSVVTLFGSIRGSYHQVWIKNTM
jgi:hypothetical protein